MKNSLLRKGILSSAIATTLALGVAPQAFAAPGVFEVSPNSLGLTGYSPFNADQMLGNASTLLTTTSATTATGSGWINMTSFTLNNTPILAGASGINLGGANSYALYVTFDLASTLTQGTINNPNSQGDLTALNYTLWADVGSDSVFTAADASSAIAATVAQNGADTILGTGSLISGVNGINNLGGAFLNSITTVSLTAAGSNYFTDPVPFYELAFEQFNNTTQGIEISGNLVSINQETGSIDFNRVPEPATLALMGLGLLGMSATRRRNK